MPSLLDRSGPTAVLWCCGVIASVLVGCRAEPASHRPAAADVQANGIELAARGYRRYDRERGIVSYRLSGDEEGIETLFFDHWGMREARLRQEPGRTPTTLILTDGAATFVVDIAAAKALKKVSPDWDRIAEGKHLGTARQRRLESLGGRRVGQGRILAFACERWEVPALGTTSCLWQHVPLASETRLGGAYQRRIAVRVEMEPTIPEERFELPDRVRIETDD